MERQRQRDDIETKTEIDREIDRETERERERHKDPDIETVRWKRETRRLSLTLSSDQSHSFLWLCHLAPVRVSS